MESVSILKILQWECVEHSAIGMMVSDGQLEMETMGAISSEDGYHVLPPCGKCREFAKGFGNPYVILLLGKQANLLKKVRLSYLLPHDWNSAWKMP